MELLFLVVSIITFLLSLACFSGVLAKAGYSRWWTLLGLVPVLNLAMLWFFAFTKWPNASVRTVEQKQRF